MLQLLVQCASASATPPPEMRCVFNHPAVMISLIWAIALVLGIVFILCYLHFRNKMKKEMVKNEREHEERLKEMAYVQEKYWHFQNQLEKDFKKKLEEKLQELTKEKENLSQQLKDEKKDREKTLKQERLQAEHDFYEKILSQIYSTNNHPSN